MGDSTCELFDFSATNLDRMRPPKPGNRDSQGGRGREHKAKQQRAQSLRPDGALGCAGARPIWGPFREMLSAPEGCVSNLSVAPDISRNGPKSVANIDSSLKNKNGVGTICKDSEHSPACWVQFPRFRAARPIKYLFVA